MKHYLKVCLKILAGGKLNLLPVYVTLVAKSFISHKKKQTMTTVQAHILGRSITAFHYPQLINLFEEIFVYQGYRFSSDRVTPTIIDCGSNIGVSVFYFKTLYPKSNIVAFEPDAATFELLTANVNGNKLQGIEIHRVALSNADADVELYSRPAHSGSLTMSLFKSDGKTEKSIVEARRLSTYIKSDVDLLKIDVEGAEIQIIQDLIESNKIDSIAKMIIEYHPTVTGKSVESFIKLLESKHFSCTFEKDTLHPGATEVMIRATRELRN